MKVRWIDRSESFERYRRLWAEHTERPLNFDPKNAEAITEENGWRFDDYETELPSESSGPPVPHGPWEVARCLVYNYDFPDPRLIVGIYAPDHPIEGRRMLLKARFLFFTFWFGVRIGRVIDGTRERHGEPARVWGYSYQTLEGHFEQGEIFFEVWKLLESGRVLWRVHACSRPAHIGNPLYRLGFHIFGRPLQRKFARTAIERMQGFMAWQMGLPPEERISHHECRELHGDLMRERARSGI